MKFIVQIFKKIFKKLTDKINNYTNKVHDKPVQGIKPDQNENGDIKPLKDRRIARKRKSFKSFMREQDNQSRIRKYLEKKRRRKYRNNKSKYQRMLMNESEQFDQNWKDGELSEIYTKEFQSQKSNCGAIFKDRNGCQISFISNISEKSNQNSQNISVDSDPELVKFVFEDKQKQKQKKPKMRFNFGSFLEKDNKQWWQKVIQSHQNDRSKQQQRSQSLSSSNIFKKNKAKRSNQNRDRNVGKIKKKKNHICIIQLIDLINCQDAPKIYQIPLSFQIL